MDAKPSETLPLHLDLHPPLDWRDALVESERCFFCHDAPCLQACPTDIDIPLFIRQINTGNVDGSAKTIFSQNILGGMCARVCPTETLCEEACVRQAEEAPVRIGLLQRYATDHFMDSGRHPEERAPDTGRTVAVIGAGPSGLACAHRLARYGHQVSLIDANPKLGGLNEYGIASYKSVDDFAQREAAFVLGIGGVSVEQGVRVGVDRPITELIVRHDAVFVGVGLGDVNRLAIDDESLDGVHDAVSFIAQLRQDPEGASATAR